MRRPDAQQVAADCRDSAVPIGAHLPECCCQPAARITRQRGDLQLDPLTAEESERPPRASLARARTRPLPKTRPPATHSERWVRRPVACRGRRGSETLVYEPVTP